MTALLALAAIYATALTVLAIELWLAPEIADDPAEVDALRDVLRGHCEVAR